MSINRGLFFLTCFLISFQDLIAITQAEELVLKYDFTNGSKLPTTKHAGISAGNEFGVYNTSAITLEMMLQSGIDYLSVRNLHTAVATNRYGYLSLAASEGYTVTITRIEVLSKKGNSNTLNARCYLYDSLKNSPMILSNMIYSGTNAGYPIPENWELKSFVPSAGIQTLNDTVFFSFTSTQAVAGTVPSDWQIDELLFYGVVSGGQEIINDVDVSLDVTKPGHVISKYLNGSHFVYGNEADNIYKDEHIADWMRASKVGMIRWPGGTVVMSYHWDNLTGDNFGPDRWDVANYVEKNISPSNYMDLDEFIAYCRRVNAEPMVGVNIKSGKIFKTDADGLDEARRLIQYCVTKNYNVKHWYIGNEGYANWVGKNIYPTYIDMYATELKKVDPNITIVGDWKFGPEDKKRYEESMYIISNSNQLDVMEYHEKWGDIWGLGTGNTVAEWKSDISLFSGRFDYYCKKFKTDVSNLGKTTKLSMNEWGIGDLVDGNEYQYALLAADYMTLIYKNDIYSACYWNLNIGATKSKIFKTKNSNQDFDKFNPVEKVFRQYAPLLGGNYLEIVSSNNKVYGVASINKSKDTIHVLILNKSAEKCRVKLTLNKFNANNTVLTDWFDELGNSMTEELTKGDLSYVLPAYSFTRLQFTGNAVTALNATKHTNGDMNVIRDTNNIHVYLPDNEMIKSTSVVDMNGSIVRKEFSYDNTIVLPLNGLKSGVFTLLVNGEKRNYAKKIIL